eukprot:scaffold412_cov311-Pavlova_lutheri.AAC.39
MHFAPITRESSIFQSNTVRRWSRAASLPTKKFAGWASPAALKHSDMVVMSILVEMVGYILSNQAVEDVNGISP